MPSDVKHDIWVDYEKHVVKIANNDDGFYVQTFHNMGEVQYFIDELKKAAQLAFSNDVGN